MSVDPSLALPPSSDGLRGSDCTLIKAASSRAPRPAMATLSRLVHPEAELEKQSKKEKDNRRRRQDLRRRSKAAERGRGTQRKQD